MALQVRAYEAVDADDLETMQVGPPALGETRCTCCVLLHPLIDAMVEMRRQFPLDAAEVTAIELTVHPLVLSITGVSEPSTGLQSKFSFRHSAAVAYVDGNAGIPQYTDAKAVDPALVALRAKVSAVGDATLGRDEARAVLIAGSRRHEVHIAHASGTTANPMTDAAIEAKFTANALGVLGQARVRQAIDAVAALDAMPDVRALIDILR
jgi:2-methylcitrate dehydratase PrpD